MTHELDLEKLRALFDILADKDIHEFEHEDEHVRIRVVRGARPTVMAGGASMGPPSLFSGAPTLAPYGAAGAATSLGGLAGGGAAGGADSIPADSVDVTSPFVGTFYRSPSPDAPSFVEVGSVVRAGQTLCIVEAMKLMNEIEAECSGTIVEVFAQNAKAVEFGQKLFRIKKA